jgi:hypothetical protein
VEHVKEALSGIADKDFGIFSPGEIDMAGEFIYGPRFASQLGRALGVTAGTVRRWSAGTRTPSAKLSREIAVLVRTRQGQRVQFQVMRFSDFIAKNRSNRLKAIMLIPFVSFSEGRQQAAE